MAEKVKVGLIGCGNISSQYLRSCATFSILDVVACADVLPRIAEARAAEFGLRALSPDELLADPEIEIVINLTIPAVHAAVSLDIIAGGQARVQREAACRDARGRSAHPRSARARAGRARRLRAGHLSRRRPADVPQADR